MIEFYDYKNHCWWCGNEADSAEHKYKQTDLKREFGKVPYKGRKEIVRGISGKLRKILGPNSKEVKFKKNICQNCNNNKSQSFDSEYEKFTKYIKNHENEIISKRQFIFSEIYGDSWADCRANLLRYYVKHICCRLASNNIFIRNEIINFLNGTSKLFFLNFHIEIREDLIAMIKFLREEGLGDGCLWIGDLIYDISKSTGKMSNARSYHGYRWLRMNYLYDDSCFQAEDNFSDNIVNLISDYNIDPTKILARDIAP
jgi:hypothetical protein